MKDCMVDLETLGTLPGCVILSIGAVMFDPATGKVGERFYVVINKNSCLYHGLTVNSDTVNWWLNQSPEARQVLDMADTSPVRLGTALLDFTTWLERNSDVERVRVWGNGADFDNGMLQVAYGVAALPCPWKFYNNRCYRTLKSFFPAVKLRRVGTYHSAVDDAESQAWHAIELLQQQARLATLGWPWWRKLAYWYNTKFRNPF